MLFFFFQPKIGISASPSNSTIACNSSPPWWPATKPGHWSTVEKIHTKGHWSFINVKSMLGKIFRRHFIQIFFLIVPRKQVLTLHAKCFQWRQCAQNVKSFSGKYKKTIVSLLSSELAQRVIKFNACTSPLGSYHISAISIFALICHLLPACTDKPLRLKGTCSGNFY